MNKAVKLCERSRKLLDGITSGPWQVKNDMIPDCLTIIANVDGETIDGVTHNSYDFIATCVDEFDEFSLDAVGNARLIAAAPTLIAEQADALEASSQRIKELEGCLSEARWYLADHQEAQPNDETRHTLAKIDALLQQKETSND